MICGKKKSLQSYYEKCESDKEEPFVCATEIGSTVHQVIYPRPKI